MGTNGNTKKTPPPKKPTPARVVNGVAFYEARRDGSETAEIRSVHATTYMNREFAHGLPLKVAQAIYSEMTKAIHADKVPNEQKLQNLAVLIHNLQVRAANTLNRDNLLGLACIYFYVDGEDPADYSGQFDEYKMGVMKGGTADDILFFCARACKRTPQLKEISSIDLKAFMTAADNLISSQKPHTPT